MCSLCNLKLLEMLTNLSISFFETLTVIARAAVLRDKNLVCQNVFAINPNANSRQQCLTCSSRKTRVHIANLSFCAIVNDTDTKIDPALFVDLPTPIRNVLYPGDSHSCTSRNLCFFGEQRRQLFPLLHGLVKKQPSSGT